MADFEWRHLWWLATKLDNDLKKLPSNCDEYRTRARSVVNRAYYAAYNIAHRYAADRGFDRADGKGAYQREMDQQEGSSHALTWKTLKFAKGDPMAMKAGEAGLELHIERKACDYRDELFHTRLDEMAKSAIMRAKSICEFLGADVAAIRAEYEKKA